MENSIKFGLPVGTKLYHKFGDKVVECQILTTETVSHAGQVFNSLSKAGLKAMGDRGLKGNCNGWDFWKSGADGRGDIENPNKRPTGERTPGATPTPRKASAPEPVVFVDPEAEEVRILEEAKARIKAMRDQAAGQMERAKLRLTEVRAILDKLITEEAMLAKMVEPDGPASVQTLPAPEVQIAQENPVQTESPVEPQPESTPTPVQTVQDKKSGKRKI